MKKTTDKAHATSRGTVNHRTGSKRSSQAEPGHAGRAELRTHGQRQNQIKTSGTIGKRDPKQLTPEARQALRKKLLAARRKTSGNKKKHGREKLYDDSGVLQTNTALGNVVKLFLGFAKLLKWAVTGINGRNPTAGPGESDKKYANESQAEPEHKIGKLQFFVAGSILAAGILAGWALIEMAPAAVKQPVIQRTPLIEVVQVNQVARRIPVFSRGTVQPKTQINLIAEVEGKATYVSVNLKNGGVFKEGELLLQIDASRYELEVTKAQSAVASAELFLEKATATAKVARRGAKRNASAYALHIPQLNEAKAKLAAAKADLQVAQLQLANTQLKAPFTGRVKVSDINVGQYINAGALVADIYALDMAIIRLPVSNKQLKLIDLPWFYSDSIAPAPSPDHDLDNSDETRSDAAENNSLRQNLPQLKVSGFFGGSKYTWQGKIEYAEGGLDENQIMYLVGEIGRPYQRSLQDPERPPLEPGLFVEAEIQGRHFDAVYEVPRQALHGGNKVWTVDEKNRLHAKQVNVVYRGPEMIYVDRGLSDGEQIVITALDYVVNGMEVRIGEEAGGTLEEGRQSSQSFSLH
ncbi:efflux RND transporter periplasmic adaptor subunit [Exilibacterium tricleocarpae]|uniref:Efflux RND transporter periplasmic adaptor subunit n=1 Tax=Exilibacterium tricleocarpae TaxID=2591008 RepID=A0A545SNF6_9GAMM|nr:efflux RND transporter periplasmic adaptor subunit [Exilibacterium tricleocarpae]TQV66505.1 efflux RND transporter periplasmic adaptor subunit [Exilibacterium tricleocarpae]